jgi:DnaJ-class molecular chaperone
MNVKCPVCKGKGERQIAIEEKGKVTGSYPAKCDYCNGSGSMPKSMTYAGKRKA